MSRLCRRSWVVTMLTRQDLRILVHFFGVTPLATDRDHGERKHSVLCMACWFRRRNLRWRWCRWFKWNQIGLECGSIISLRNSLCDLCTAVLILALRAVCAETMLLNARDQIVDIYQNGDWRRELGNTARNDIPADQRVRLAFHQRNIHALNLEGSKR